MQHPAQNAARRTELADDQHPFAVVLGCSDSRVAAELVFDQGLGDLFVVRTAGHVLDTTVLGSVEYGVAVLGTPLVVVLGHDRCGAVRAASDALLTGTMPPGFVRDVAERVIPSLIGAAGPPADGADPALALPPAEEPHRRHVRTTVRRLLDVSAVVADAVAEGRCAVVGLEYTLAEGTTEIVESVGSID
jgi:carbonic anhydrase